MLTAKGKYSLKALAHLARLDSQATTQAFDIAETNGIPKKFLDAILGELRNAASCKAKRGRVAAIGWHGYRARSKSAW